MQLSFDPTTGLPEYRFDYTPSYLSFYVDGQFAKTGPAASHRTL